MSSTGKAPASQAGPSAGTPAVPLTLEDLSQQVAMLAALTRKNSAAIAQTGQQLIRMAIDETRTKMTSTALPSGAGAAGAAGAADAAGFGQEDVEELVKELQEQLDLIEIRSIRRQANSQLTADADVIAPIPGIGGEYPPEGMFPATLGEFKALKGAEVLGWMRWYGIEDTTGLSSRLVPEPTTTEVNDDGKEEPVMDETDSEYFDRLARYVGLRCRRSEGAW
ncbi:Mrp8p [Dipodascopsis tothii]|uniref:Mrp8p n=1 Tax=Dipodascopsis tothii TaxID=44089 RepID=UPI0034CE3028